MSKTRTRFMFTVFYDDSDDRLHIHRQRITEHETPKLRTWKQDSSDIERDWAVLRRDEFLDLIQEGWGALSYQAQLVREAGVRVDGTEQVYAVQEIPIRKDAAHG